MIKRKDTVKTIKCDRCGIMESHHQRIADEMFFKNGWTINPHSKKYIHKCYACQTAKNKKAIDFVRIHFDPAFTKPIFMDTHLVGYEMGQNINWSNVKPKTE